MSFKPAISKFQCFRYLDIFINVITLNVVKCLICLYGEGKILECSDIKKSSFLLMKLT